MKQSKKYILWGGMMAMLALSGCTREQLDNIVSSAAEVQFGVSTMWETEPGTRTEYSGDKVDVGSSEKERINWVQTTDHIRIYSPEAVKMNTSDTPHIQDYYISSVPDNANEKSRAKIACVEENGLQWNGTSAHHFYALYPAPGTEWKYDQSVSVPEASAKIESSGSTGAKITGVIPNSQEVKWNAAASNGQKEFEPNMNYAYMYAANLSATPGNDVQLSFEPLVTTLQFTIKAADVMATGFKLTGFKVQSTGYLAGTFTATFNGSSTTPSISITGTSNEVHVDIPSEEQNHTLAQNDVMMVTLFTLPVDLSALTVEMTFKNGNNQTESRTLALKYKDGTTLRDITVPACHKVYINSLGVSGIEWDYHFDIVNPTDLGAAGGTSTMGRVTSYRENTTTGTREAVGWTIQGYYSDAACTQSIPSPSWISYITPSGSGSTSGSESMTIAYDASPAGTSTTTSNSTLKNTTSIGSDDSTETYKNLSNPSDMDSDDIAESANCYIVNQPGYYRIPLVEGNGIINNEKNKDKTTYLGASGTNQMKFVNYITNSQDVVYLKDIGATWDAGCYPEDVDVIWQDVDDLITEYSISEDHEWLLFRVAGTDQGNAFLNVRQGEVAMWQYHIWVTDFIPYNYPGYSSSTYGKDVTVTGSNSTTYDMMPLNLGWVGGDEVTTTYPERKVYVKLAQTGDGTATAVLELKQTEMVKVKYSGGRAPYFQWGRKDPFWPSSPVYGEWGELYQQEGELQTYYWATFRFLDGWGPSPGSSQFTFWLGDSSNGGDWLGISNACNLWNASSNATGVHTGAVRKTIYDPCPAGYCMPVQGAFSGFTSDRSNYNSRNTFGAWDDGWHIYTDATKTETVYFPSHGYLGYVGYDSDGGCYWSDGGCYWTADTNASSAYLFRFSVHAVGSQFFFPDHSHSRFYGCSVRPVRDTNKAN